MNKNIIIIISAIILVSFYTGCSSVPSCITVVPPTISLTGEKTVIERQIIGDYRELEKDAWSISSVKTTTGRSASQGQISGDPEIVKAVKIRDYISDKVLAYKKEGAIGESATGYVAYRETKKYESSPDLKNALMLVVEDENSARKTIFTRSLINIEGVEPGKAKVENFGRLFAEEQRAIAEKGDWIQDNSGRWIRK